MCVYIYTKVSIKELWLINCLFQTSLRNALRIEGLGEGEGGTGNQRNGTLWKKPWVPSQANLFLEASRQVCSCPWGWWCRLLEHQRALAPAETDFCFVYSRSSASGHDFWILVRVIFDIPGEGLLAGPNSRVRVPWWFSTLFHLDWGSWGYKQSRKQNPLERPAPIFQTHDFRKVVKSVCPRPPDLIILVSFHNYCPWTCFPHSHSFCFQTIGEFFFGRAFNLSTAFVNVGTCNSLLRWSMSQDVLKVCYCILWG